MFSPPTSLVDAVLGSPSSRKELHLNSTSPNFSCVEMDKRVARVWKGDAFPSNESYTCVTTDFGGIDISPANPPLHRPPNARLIAGAVIGGVAGAALLCVLVWWLKRRHRRQSAASAAQTEQTRGEGNELELEDVAVAQAYNGHARRREAGEQPPRYTRTGKPGEVPPVYGMLCL